VDFSDIEIGVLNELENHGLTAFNIVDFDVMNENTTVQAPAVYCSIENAEASMSGNDVRLDASLYLTVVFSDVTSEAARRNGIYSIIFGIILSLAGNDLGLGINELEPVSIENMSTITDTGNDLTIFKLKFKVGFEIEIDEDADALDLITLGLEYLLKSGDPTVHASDEIDLTN